MQVCHYSFQLYIFSYCTLPMLPFGLIPFFIPSLSSLLDIHCHPVTLLALFLEELDTHLFFSPLTTVQSFPPFYFPSLCCCSTLKFLISPDGAFASLSTCCSGVLCGEKLLVLIFCSDSGTNSIWDFWPDAQHCWIFRNDGSIMQWLCPVACQDTLGTAMDTEVEGQGQKGESPLAFDVPQR